MEPTERSSKQIEKDLVEKTKPSLLEKALEDANSTMRERKNQLINTLFERITHQIHDFVETETYQGKLITKMESFYHKDNEAIFYLNHQDMYLQEQIKKSMPLIQLELLETDAMGGFIIKLSNDSRMDFTLDTILTTKQNQWLQIPDGEIN